MKKYHTVSMHLTPQAQGSRVFIDGVEVQGLLDVKVETGLGAMTTVTLKFHAEVTADIKAVVEAQP